jgi:hypothetical protein
MNENELFFWKDGDYDAQGGFFIRSELKTFIKQIIEAGHEPVGIKIDLESFNVEVLVAAK